MKGKQQTEMRAIDIMFHAAGMWGDGLRGELLLDFEGSRPDECAKVVGEFRPIQIWSAMDGSG